MLARLVRSANLVLTNMTPSSIADVGLDYENLCQIKSDIILVTSTDCG